MPSVINPVAYDRTADDWKPWDFVLVVDQEGNEVILKIVRDERLGTSRILIWDTTHPLPAGGKATKLELQHLSPPRENRLYVMTPYWEIISTAVDQETPLQDEGLCVPLEDIPCSIDLELENPTGNRRLGTAVAETYELQVPFGEGPQPVENKSVGGPNGGTIPNYLIPLRDDLSRVWDFGAIFGSFPSITVFNRSIVDLGSFSAQNPASTRLQSKGFLCFTGDRYMVEDPTENERNALIDRDLGYTLRRITIGGVTQATTRA